MRLEKEKAEREKEKAEKEREGLEKDKGKLEKEREKWEKEREKLDKARDKAEKEAARAAAEKERELDDLRDKLKGLMGGADSESLARLCKIRELESERQEVEEKLRKALAELEEAREQQVVAERHAEAVEASGAERRAELERDVAEARARVEELEHALRVANGEIEAAGELPTDVKGKLKDLERLLKKNEVQASVHRLQMLLRMAEITKLEEHIKCSRRADAIKEEKLGLLTYNLASAESQISLDSEEASAKRQTVREERMGALNKKQKAEEDKMKTNEESYSTQSKRLKEKLRELETNLATFK